MRAFSLMSGKSAPGERGTVMIEKVRSLLYGRMRRAERFSIFDYRIFQI